MGGRGGKGGRRGGRGKEGRGRGRMEEEEEKGLKKDERVEISKDVEEENIVMCIASFHIHNIHGI